MERSDKKIWAIRDPHSKSVGRKKAEEMLKNRAVDIFFIEWPTPIDPRDVVGSFKGLHKDDASPTLSTLAQLAVDKGIEVVSCDLSVDATMKELDRRDPHNSPYNSNSAIQPWGEAVRDQHAAEVIADKMKRAKGNATGLVMFGADHFNPSKERAVPAESPQIPPLHKLISAKSGIDCFIVNPALESNLERNMNDSDLNILDTSFNQLTHLITASHQQQNAHLLGRKFTMLAAAAPAPAGAPDTTDLNTMLNNVVKVPGTTSIATVPTTPDTAMYQMLGQVQTLDSYISLLTAFCVYNEHPTPYDITKPDEASAFVRATAKWRNYVITGGAVKAMAGYLPVSSIVTQQYSKQVTSADLHLEFLAELFGGFGFPAAAMKELDSILTKVVAKLGDLKLSFETQSDTLDHFLTFYYFATVPGTGGEDQPPAMYVAKVRTFYLHVDQSSWKAAAGKSSVEHFQFNMNYYDMDTTMSTGLVATDMTAINSTIQTLTGKTAAEVNTLMNMQAVRADPQKS